MRFLLKIFLLLVLIGIVFLLAVIFVPIMRSGPANKLQAGYQVPEMRGEYLARMADCAACHTAPNGADFAGGRAVTSPFGVIYSANITPSRDGIAGWTLDDFRAALQDGIRPDGTLIYPAMPYENYRKIQEEDVVALYDYFMKSVQPVDVATPPSEMIFPFNQRWGIRMWNWLAIPGKVGFEPRYGDAKLDRGAYLVESLGHCGACHTPRDFFFKQTALDATSPNFLTGQTLNGWYAPDLRGPDSSLARWNSDDLRQYLLTARNNYTAAIGPMALVVADSLEYTTPEDMDAMIAYLQKIRVEGQAAPVRVAQPTTALLSAAKPDMPLGARLYLDNCNACHQVNGKGAPGIFPELDKAKSVTASDPSGLIEIILGGSRMPSTALRPEDVAMPGFGWRLQDEEVAVLVNFLRSAWSNNAAEVTAGEVAKIRAKPLTE